MQTTTNRDKIPHDKEAEAALVNLAYNYPECLYRLDEAGVQDHLFFGEEACYLYGLIKQLTDEVGTPPTKFNIIGRVKSLGEVGQDYLNYFSRAVTQPIPEQWFDKYLKRLVTAYKKREVLQLAGRLAQVATDDSLPAEVGITMAIDEAERIDRATNPLDIIDGVKLETIMRADYEEGKSRPAGTPWGISSLDNFTGGTRLGEFTLVYAPPGYGKSALLQWAFYHRAKTKTRAQLYVTIGDMTARQVWYRLMQQETGVSSLTQNRGDFTDRSKFNHWNKIDTHLSKLPELPIYMYEAEQMESAEIRRLAKSLLRKVESLDIYVDHIGQFSDIADNIYMKTNIIAASLLRCAHGIRDDAGNFLVSINAISPVNKADKFAGSMDLGHAPENIFRLEPLKPEKGGPDPEKSPDEQSGLVKLQIEKNRNGGKGAVQLWFDAPKARFMDVTEMKG